MPRRPDSYRDLLRPQDTHGSLTNEIPRRFALLGMTLVVLLVFYRLRDTFVIPNASEESQSQTIPRIQLNRGNPVGWRFLDADVTFILWGFRRFTPVFIFLRKMVLSQIRQWLLERADFVYQCTAS